MGRREFILEPIIKWLYQHPWGWLIVFIVAVIAFVAWVAHPITWRDGEGPLTSEDSRASAWWRARWFP